MSKESDIFLFFKGHNPERLTSFHKRKRIEKFWKNVSDSQLRVSAADRLDEDKDHIPSWFNEDHMIAIFAFKNSLTENEERLRLFFLEFARDYYSSDKGRALVSAKAAFEFLDKSIRDFLPKFATLDTSNKIAVKSADMEKGFVNPKDAVKSYHYASESFKSLLRYQVLKDHPTIVAKEVIAYVLGGILLLLALAAIAYLTLQSMGLIHLTWMIPVAAIGISVGAGVGGAGVLVAANPRAQNGIRDKFYSLFSKDKKRSDSPLFKSLQIEPHEPNELVI